MDSSSIVAKAGGEVEVLLIGEIGWDADPKSFAQELSGLGKVSKVHLRINSPGGSVFDAVSMRSSLLALDAEINVTIEGLCASCATFFLTIADSVKVTSDSAVMIHEASVWGGGEAGDLRKMAERLDAVNGEMVKAYAIRMDKSEADVRKLMADETWFSAAEAVESGLADEVIEVEHKPAKKFVTQAIAALASKFKNAPPWVTAQLSVPQKQLRASAPERKTSMSATVFKALGLHEGDDVAAVTKIEALKAEAAGLRAELAQHHDIHGCKGPEALGAATANKDSAGALRAMTAKHEAFCAEVDSRDLKSDLQKAFDTGHISANTREKLTAQLLKEPGFVKSYLATAPKEVPVGEGLKQPAVEGVKAFADMDWREKSALKESDPEAFAAGVDAEIAKALVASS